MILMGPKMWTKKKTGGTTEHDDDHNDDDAFWKFWCMAGVHLFVVVLAWSSKLQKKQTCYSCRRGDAVRDFSSSYARSRDTGTAGSKMYLLWLVLYLFDIYPG